MIKITGKLPLLSDKAKEESLRGFVERTFPDFINVSDGVVYISGFIEENDLEIVEEFLIKIFEFIDLNEPVRIKMKSEDSKSVGEYLINEEGIIDYRFDGVAEAEPRIVH